MTNKNFKLEEVLRLYDIFKQSSIKIWLDGGWGVDALLGKQTRLHADLDIIVLEKDVSMIRIQLAECGYKEIKRDDTSAWNFVLCDTETNEIDVHVINFDEHGNGVYGPLERGVFYPADSLLGVGYLNGIKLHCLTPEYQLVSHRGYPLQDKDFLDIKALCEKFNLEYLSDSN